MCAHKVALFLTISFKTGGETEGKTQRIRPRYLSETAHKFPRDNRHVFPSQMMISNRRKVYFTGEAELGSGRKECSLRRERRVHDCRGAAGERGLKET